jgi:hypothetical protein
MKRQTILLGLFLFLPNVALAIPPEIRLDSGTGNYRIDYDGQSGRVHTIFEPSTKIFPHLSVDIAPGSGGILTYSYKLANDLQSPQAIWNFGLTPKPSTVSVSIPTGWRYREYDNDPIAGWTMDSFLGNPVSIQPGHSLTFSLTSRSLPGISIARIEGLPAPGNLAFPEEPGEDVEGLLAPLHSRDFISLKTLAADFNPINATVSGLIDRLISIKHRAYDEGWLGDAKFVEKLDTRLDQATAALARDKKKLARVRLSQFVHELEKAHGEHGDEHGDEHKDKHGKDKAEHRDKKFVNNAAFQLLKINADFIIAKLPAKAKDNDEEDECRRAEGEKDADSVKKGNDD